MLLKSLMLLMLPRLFKLLYDVLRIAGMGIVCEDESSLDAESDRPKSCWYNNFLRRSLLLPRAVVSTADHLALLDEAVWFIFRNVLFAV